MGLPSHPLGIATPPKLGRPSDYILPCILSMSVVHPLLLPRVPSFEAVSNTSSSRKECAAPTATVPHA